MSFAPFYRGGGNLQPRPGEVRLDAATGLVLPIRGVSVFDEPDNLERFGGAFRVGEVPNSLQIVQRGANNHHFEIVPASPMTMLEYVDALDQIVLSPV